MATKKMYVEPGDYFPKSVRKKNGIGEYAKPTSSKTSSKGSTSKGKKK